MDITRVTVDPSVGSTASGTNAYVLGREDALLVDPPATHPDLDAALADRSLGHVAVTHHHPDHVGGVARYVERYGPTTWARAGREQSFVTATGVTPDRTFVEGTVIPTGDGPVCVLETPGHAPEHVAFAVGHAGRGGAILVGDLAVRTGSVAVGAPGGDVRAYLSSLRRLYARDPETLHPGHGPRIEDPRGTVERLVRHRLARERRVLSAVRGGARTVEEILEAAYDKDLGGVREMAAATVEAHLEKLAVEGTVVRDGDRVEPTA